MAVAGTSMGSVFSTLFASGIQGHQLEVILLELELQFKERRIMLRSLLKILPFVKDKSDGFIAQDGFEGFLKEMFDDLKISMLSEIEMPLCIVTTDLNTGEIVLFSNKKEYFKEVAEDTVFYEGDVEISKVIAASCTFPLVFQSVIINERRLVDVESD